jgi:hypothetical protein
LSGETIKNQEWVAPKLNTTADGSMYLSLQDWLAWEDALRKKSVLRATSWEKVFAPVRLNSGKTYPYGFGWALHDGRGLPRYSHTGQWQGFTAAYLHVIDADLSIIVLGNLSQGNPRRIAERIAQIHLPEVLLPTRAAPTAPAPALLARVRRLLVATKAGTLRESEFEFVGSGYFPAVPLSYKELLDDIGPVERIEVLEKRELGDDTVFILRGIAGVKQLVIELLITPTGKFAWYGLRVEPYAQ